MSASISVAMIAGNEERVIGRAIDSIRAFVDEVVVCCNGTDHTDTVAKDHGARVVHDVWDEDFARLRNVALTHATGDYILSLDCDEWLDEHSARKLRTLAKKTAPNQVWLTRVEAPDDREGVVVPKHFYGARFFPRQGMSWVEPIHEQVIYQGEQSKTTYTETDLVVIHHDGYLSDHRPTKEKHERNLRILRRQVEAKPDDPKGWHELGRQHNVAHEWDQALECFEKSLAIFEQWKMLDGTLGAGVALLAATAAVHAGKPERALAITSKAIIYHPRYAGLLNARGVAFRALGKPMQAIDCFCRCLALKGYATTYEDEPSTSGWRALLNLGHAFLEVGEPVRAWECFRAAQAEMPDHPRLRLSTAIPLAGVGEIEAAWREVQAVRERWPEEHEAVAMAEQIISAAWMVAR